MGEKTDTLMLEDKPMTDKEFQAIESIFIREGRELSELTAVELRKEIERNEDF